MEVFEVRCRLLESNPISTFVAHLFSRSRSGCVHVILSVDRTVDVSVAPSNAATLNNPSSSFDLESGRDDLNVESELSRKRARDSVNLTKGTRYVE